MRKQVSSLMPWLVAAGGLSLAWAVWRRQNASLTPEIALHSGLALLGRPHRVLAIGPHPNDLEAFVGGTLKLLSQNGSAVTMAVLSRGEQAGNRANIGEIRAKEAESAAVILGAELIQLDLPDEHIGQGLALEQAIDHLWRRTQPDVLLAFDPRGPGPFENHPDHVALGAAILSRVRRAVTEGVSVYLYGAPHPNVLVDVTEVIQEKRTAHMAHRSQLMGPDSIAKQFTSFMSGLASQRVPAYYTEGLYRLV